MRNLLFFKKLPLIIALSMGLMACNDSDNDPNETSPVTTPSASVALQVFDNTTGSQINNAQVSIVNKTVSLNTDIEGKAQLQKIAVGRSVIKISKTGYADQFVTVDLVDKQELSGIIVQLIPLNLGGSVSAITGGTVNLATVQLKLLLLQIV